MDAICKLRCLLALWKLCLDLERIPIGSSLESFRLCTRLHCPWRRRPILKKPNIELSNKNYTETCLLKNITSKKTCFLTRRYRLPHKRLFFPLWSDILRHVSKLFHTTYLSINTNASEGLWLYADFGNQVDGKGFVRVLDHDLVAKSQGPQWRRRLQESLVFAWRR